MCIPPHKFSSSLSAYATAGTIKAVRKEICSAAERAAVESKYKPDSGEWCSPGWACYYACVALYWSTNIWQWRRIAEIKFLREEKGSSAGSVLKGFTQIMLITEIDLAKAAAHLIEDIKCDGKQAA